MCDNQTSIEILVNRGELRRSLMVIVQFPDKDLKTPSAIVQVIVSRDKLTLQFGNYNASIAATSNAEGIAFVPLDVWRIVYKRVRTKKLDHAKLLIESRKLKLDGLEILDDGITLL